MQWPWSLLQSLLCMALAVATSGHSHESHKGVFFFIVMFCVQPCSCHFARPISRLRSSSGNCEPMVRGCGTNKVQSQLWPAHHLLRREPLRLCGILLGRGHLRQAGLLLLSKQLLPAGLFLWSDHLLAPLAGPPLFNLESCLKN